MVENIILHIGMYHTGTTAMQEILSLNPPELHRQGIYFYMSMPLTYALHCEVSPKLPEQYHLPAKDLFTAIVAEANAKNAHTLVLSHEGITYNPYYRSLTNRLQESHDVRRRNAAHIRNRLYELCQGKNVRIVFYPRRQDHWINSNYCNAIQKNSLPHITHADIEALASDCLQYHTLIGQWASLFGRENICIRPYEKVRMPHGTLYDFCCNVLHCDIPDCYANKANITPSREAIILCRALLPYFDNQSVQAILEHCTNWREHDVHMLLDYQQRQAILDRFSVENKNLAQEFFDTQEPLFLESLPDAKKFPLLLYGNTQIAPKRIAQILTCTDTMLKTIGSDVDISLLLHGFDVLSSPVSTETALCVYAPHGVSPASTPDVVLRVPKGHMPEKIYALRVIFCEFLGLHMRVERSEHDTYEVCTVDGTCVLHIAEMLFANATEGQWLCEAALPKNISWLSSDILDEPIPVFYGSTQVYRDNAVWHSGADFVGMVFFMLTRFEETLCRERDKFLRIPARTAFAYKAGFVEKPVVNQWVAFIAGILTASGIPCKPQGKFTLISTHDLDYFEDDDSLTWLASTEQQLGIRSIFNIVGRTPSTYFEPEFALATKARASIILALQHTYGHRLGFHPGFATWIHPTAWKEQYESLRTPQIPLLKEGRQHYLRYSVPFTLRLWEENGMELDTGLGYADCFGFRCGTGDAFPVFDVLQRRTMTIWEQPLIMMDATHHYYVGMKIDEMFDRGNTLAATATKFNTPMTILFHNSFFSVHNTDSKFRKLLYKQFLHTWS